MSSVLSSKVDGFLFTWKVENINVSFFKERIVSPRFVAYNLYKSSWIMSLHSLIKQDGFDLNIECTEADVMLLEKIDVILTVTVLMSNGKEFVLKEEEYFDFENGGALKKVASFQNFLLSEDTLVLNCHMQKPNHCFTHEGRLQFPLATLPIIRCIVHTSIGSEKRCCIWKVRNFANLLPENQKKCTLFSTVPQSPELEICGTLSKKSKFHLEVHVVSEKRIFIVGKISILTPKNELKWTKVKGFLVESGSMTKIIFKFPLIINQRCVLSELHDGDLNLLCEFSFSTGKMHSEIKESNYLVKECFHLLKRQIFNVPTENSELNGTTTEPKKDSILDTEDQNNYSDESKGMHQTLKKDLKNFYLQKNHCDVTFQIETEKLLAHKSILCSRSPVFSAMFDSDMKETVSQEVEIVDMDTDTLDQFLLFLYCETLEDLTWERATKLLYAATKYQVDSLKVACSSFLMSNISVINVCEALKLSDHYQDKTLKALCQNLIADHETEIFSSKEWELLTLENPLLSAKTLKNHFGRKKSFQ